MSKKARLTPARLAPSATLLMWLAGTMGSPCLAADSEPPASPEQQSLEVLRNTVVNLLQALVDKGVMTKEQAQQLVKQAEQRATDDVAARAQQHAQEAQEDQGAIRVPYVPEIVKREISRQVAAEVRPEVAADVVKQAKTEGWGVPGALPEWMRHVRLAGELTLRAQEDYFGHGNDAGCPPGTIYQNCTILDFNAINQAGGIAKAGVNEFLNITQDRTRLRARARLGAEVELTDSIHAGIRLATGSLQDPSSETQTLGQGFGRYTVGFDQIYLRWQGRTAEKFTYLSAIGGRFPDPFYAPTELVWQKDLAFEGVSMTGRLGIGDGSADQSYLWITGGGFPVQEVPLANKNDKWLVGGQLGASLRFADDQRLTVAGAYYNFIHVEGIRNTLESTLTNYTAPLFIRYGNSVFDISNTADPTVNLFALAPRFRIADVALGYRVPFGSHAFFVDAEAVRNVGFKRKEILQRTGLDIAPRINGYVADISYGTPMTDRWGLWRVHFGYRNVERDAVVDALTDTDFHAGGTNAAGYFLTGDFGLATNVWSRLRYMSGREIDGARYHVDVIQADLNARF